MSFFCWSSLLNGIKITHLKCNVFLLPNKIINVSFCVWCAIISVVVATNIVALLAPAFTTTYLIVVSKWYPDEIISRSFLFAIIQNLVPIKTLPFYARQSDKQLITNRHETPICHNFRPMDQWMGDLFFYLQYLILFSSSSSNLNILHRTHKWWL